MVLILGVEQVLSCVPFGIELGFDPRGNVGYSVCANRGRIDLSGSSQKSRNDAGLVRGDKRAFVPKLLYNGDRLTRRS